MAGRLDRAMPLSEPKLEYFQWNLSEIQTFFIQWNALENVVGKMAAILSLPQFAKSTQKCFYIFKGIICIGAVKQNDWCWIFSAASIDTKWVSLSTFREIKFK